MLLLEPGCSACVATPVRSTCSAERALRTSSKSGLSSLVLRVSCSVSQGDTLRDASIQANSAVPKNSTGVAVCVLRRSCGGMRESVRSRMSDGHQGYLQMFAQHHYILVHAAKIALACAHSHCLWMETTWSCCHTS
jgi:hypothetical protein